MENWEIWVTMLACNAGYYFVIFIERILYFKLDTKNLEDVALLWFEKYMVTQGFCGE